jgi:hypothetical protein
MPSSKKRLRHLMTVCGATPSRSAMLRFSSPSAAANTIRARTTIRRSAVCLRVSFMSCARSSSLNTITNGLCLDIAASIMAMRCPSTRTPPHPHRITRM